MPTLDRLRFFSDVPTLEVAAWPDGGPQDVPDEIALPTSRVQIAKTGSFRHPHYGKFKVTRDTLDSFVRNFQAHIPTDELAVDFDHLPDYGGSTEACGWIRGLEADGERLYAHVEWRWIGAYAIRDKAYRYVSPTWSMNFVDEYGENRGPTIIAFGLTNRPFFNMPSVSVSESFSRDQIGVCEEVEPEREDGPIVAREMSDFATFAQVLGLADDATEDQILAAAKAALDKVPTDDQIVIAKTEHETLTAAAGERAELATKVADLATEVTTLKTANADARFNAAFDKAVADGKCGDAQRDHLRTFFDANEDACLAHIEAMQPVVNTTAKSGRSDQPASDADAREFSLDGIDVDEDSLALHRKAVALADKDNIDYADAYMRVAEGASV